MDYVMHESYSNRMTVFIRNFHAYNKVLVFYDYTFNIVCTSIQASDAHKTAIHLLAKSATGLPVS